MSGLDALVAQRRMQSEEELLEYQRQFQEGHMQSSTKVVRAVRKKPATEGSGESGGAAAAAASAIPAAAPAATAAAASPAVEELEPPSETLVFHTRAGISEHRAVAPPRAAFGGTSLAAKRTGFPASFRADIRSDAQQNTTAGAAAAPAAATSAASVSTAGAAPAKKSLFAQQRDRMLAQQQAAKASSSAAAPAAAAAVSSNAVAAAPAPVVAREVVTMSAAPQQQSASHTQLAPAAASSAVGSSAPRARAPLPEAQGIHEENLEKLDGMSLAEIAQAQREIEAQLPPALVAMLRAKRGGAGAGVAPSSVPRPLITPDASYPTPQQLDEYALDASLLGGDAGDSDLSSSDEEDGIDEHGERVTGVTERLRLDHALDLYHARLESHQADASQAGKLEWSAPLEPSAPVQYPDTVQGYNNDAPIWNSFRVDLEGRFIGEARTGQDGAVDVAGSSSAPSAAIDYDDPSNALYHHGDEPDKPGYTMREPLHLARSTVMSQRSLSLKVLAHVLARIRAGGYEYPREVRPTPRAVETSPSAAPQPIPPFVHLLFSHLLYLNLATLLRLSLDDNRNPAGILAALHCFESILHTKEGSIRASTEAQRDYRGHERTAPFTPIPSMAGEIHKSEEEEKRKREQKTSSNKGNDQKQDAKKQEEEDAADDGLSDNERDELLCSQDLIVGLTRMAFLDRLRYILEVFALPAVAYRANPPQPMGRGGKKGATVTTMPEGVAATAAAAGAAASMPTTSDATAGLVFLSPLIHILLSFAQHSPQAASKLFDTPRLKETLVKVILGLASIVTAGSGSVSSGGGDQTTISPSSLPISSLASTLHASLLLVGSLIQVHRDIASFFLQRGVMDSVRKFIVLSNGMPGEDVTTDDAELAILLPLSVQSLHLWRVCLAYGLDIESFMDYFPVLLGVVGRTNAWMARIHAPATSTAATAATARTSGGVGAQVTELGLQQLRAVVSVIEGLVLLFAPRATAASPSQTSAPSAPPPDLSFEFTHVAQAVEAFLGQLAAVWFAKLPASSSSSSDSANVTTNLCELLASFLHLFASYYSVLPLQPSFEWGLLRTQVEKHTNMCFGPWTQSPILARAKQVVEAADAEGVESERAGAEAKGRQTISFMNLPQSIPRPSNRTLHRSLGALFALLRWQEALLVHVPRSPPSAAASVAASKSAGSLRPPAPSAESVAMGATLGRVLASSRDLRSALLQHFYAATPGSMRADGFNRVSSRAHGLTATECEMVVSLLVLSRMDASAASSSPPSASSIASFYARVAQLIPALLRTGKQFLVSKLFSDVLFHGGLLGTLQASMSPCASCALPAPARFNPLSARLLADTYAHFAYFPEELLVSTLLATHSLLTPTLCAPVAGAGNVLANEDVSTGRVFGVQLAGGGGEEFTTCVAWMLTPLKRGKFLQVQLQRGNDGGGSSGSIGGAKLDTVLTFLRFFHVLDASMGCFTPLPLPLPPTSTSSDTAVSAAATAADGAHPMSTLFLRALMELFLLPSDVFLDSHFSACVRHFQQCRLLSHPAVVERAQERAARFEGVGGHRSSTLMFGASITAPSGQATIRTQGHQMVQLVHPSQESKASSSAAASSDPSASLHSLTPFFPFHSPQAGPPSSLWGSSFYPFFKDVLESFVADSMGDVCFARTVLPLLRMAYPTDYRILLWKECRELMASLQVPEEEGGLPLGDLGYLFPLERNPDILMLLTELLCGAPAPLTRARNPQLYRVALHHLACSLFGWEHVSGQEEVAAGERVRRVKEKCPMSIAPETMGDLMQYKYAARGEDKKETKAAAASAASAAASTAASPSPSPSPSLSPSSFLPLSPSALARISSTRATARSHPAVEAPPGFELRLVCPRPDCAKPNAMGVKQCTGCAFELSPEDAQALKLSNPFLDLIHNKPEALRQNQVVYRDDQVIVVVDRFGTSVTPTCHVDCIPTARLEDILALGREHIPLLERLYSEGLAHLRREARGDKLPWMPPRVDVEEVVTAGFNHPVSVKHLHLHCVMPPFKHEEVFTYPRWHSYEKVLRDLREFGRVRLYTDSPDDAEGAATIRRALENNRRAQQWVREYEERQKQNQQPEQQAELKQAQA